MLRLVYVLVLINCMTMSVDVLCALFIVPIHFFPSEYITVDFFDFMLILTTYCPTQEVAQIPTSKYRITDTLCQQPKKESSSSSSSGKKTGTSAGEEPTGGMKMSLTTFVPAAFVLVWCFIFTNKTLPLHKSPRFFIHHSPFL